MIKRQISFLFEDPGFCIDVFCTIAEPIRYAQPTSEPTEFNLYSETAHFYIWLRLITRHRDYNAYVHYYLKG